MKKIYSTTLLLFAIIFLWAQDKATQAFSLKEAIDYAIQNNNAAKNAKLDVEKAKAFNWEILTQGLPQISGSVDYSYYFKVPKVPAFDRIFSDPNSAFTQNLYKLKEQSNDQALKDFLGSLGAGFNNISFVLPNNLSAGFQIQQLLFDARYMFGIQARKELYKTSRLSRNVTEIEIRNTVTKAYYQAEAAQEAKALLKQNLDIIDKLLKDTRATFQQGLIEELDVNRLDLVRATLESQINTQNRLADVGLANLKFQMGLPLENTIILKDKLDDLKAGLHVEEEQKFDVKNRVEYELLSTAVILKGYDVSQKRSGYYPSLGGFLNYSWNAQTEKFGEIFKTETVNGVKSNNWYPQGLIGLSLKIPIFDSGLKMAQVKQAKVEQMKTQNDLSNFQNAAQLQYQSSLATFNSAVADEALSQKTMELSKKVFTTNQIKYQQGVGSSFELTQSEQDYAGNQLKHIQSILSVLNSKADLDKAMGVSK